MMSIGTMGWIVVGIVFAAFGMAALFAPRPRFWAEE